MLKRPPRRQEQPEAGADVPDIPTNDEDAGEYVVRSGDTLWAIAETYNTTVPALADYNGIENPDLLYPGQKIEIPPEAQSQYAQQASQKTCPLPARSKYTIPRQAQPKISNRRSFGMQAEKGSDL